MVGQHLYSYAASSVAKCLPSFPLLLSPSLSLFLTHCLPYSSALFALSPPTRCLYRIYCALLTSPHPPIPLPLWSSFFSLHIYHCLRSPSPSSHLSLSLSKHLTIEAHFFACASFVNFPVISHKIHLQLGSPTPPPPLLCAISWGQPPAQAAAAAAAFFRTMIYYTHLRCLCLLLCLLLCLAPLLPALPLPLSLTFWAIFLARCTFGVSCLVTSNTLHAACHTPWTTRRDVDADAGVAAAGWFAIIAVCRLCRVLLLLLLLFACTHTHTHT